MKRNKKPLFTEYYLVRHDDYGEFMEQPDFDETFVDITKQQIDWIVMLLEATKDVIDCKSLRSKIRKVLNNE